MRYGHLVPTWTNPASTNKNGKCTLTIHPAQTEEKIRAVSPTSNFPDTKTPGPCSSKDGQG